MRAGSWLSILREATLMAGENATLAMRWGRRLSRINAIMETVSKWRFWLEVIVLWMQYKVEEEQRKRLRA